MGTFESTAYGPPWNAMEGTGITSKGVKLKAGQQKLVVAVDPTIIPYGTKLKIWPNPFGDRNLVFTAADTGGAFQGGVRKIDFFVASGRQAQNNWGRRPVSVKIVGRGSPTDVGLLGESQRMGPVRADPAPTQQAMNGFTQDDAELARKQALLSYIQGRKFGSGGKSILGLDADLKSIPKVEAPAPAAPASQPRQTRQSPGNPTGLSPIKELFFDPLGGWKGKTNIGPIGGHGDHVHVAAGPKTTVFLGKRAQQMGLRVGENSNFNGGQRVTSGHATNSNHYSDQAIDVSGDPRKMRAFATYVKRLYGLN